MVAGAARTPRVCATTGRGTLGRLVPQGSPHTTRGSLCLGTLVDAAPHPAQVYGSDAAYEAPIMQEDGTEKNETIDELANLQAVRVLAAACALVVAHALAASALRS